MAAANDANAGEGGTDANTGAGINAGADADADAGTELNHEFSIRRKN